jgi:CSLREA domain-containing protein
MKSTTNVQRRIGNTVSFNKYLILFVLIGFLLTLANVANAATFTVTKIADTNDGVCNTDCSLREAISEANSAASADVIEFIRPMFGTAQTILLSGTQLEIVNNGSLTVNGAGASLLTVSGNNQSRIFAINSTTRATISGLSIINGNGAGNINTGFGGGILNNGGTLTLNDVRLRNNSANANGGGIFNDAGTLTITNSTIGNNNSNSGGGISNDGTLTLTKVTISSNTAVLGAGGIGNTVAMTMTNCTISGNSTTGPFGGGGIFNGNLSTLYIHYSTIVNNTANSGGGILNNDGTVTAHSSIFANNTDNNASASDFSGTLISEGSNLLENVTGAIITGNPSGNIFGQDPNLGPLADNGGLTMTHLLLAGSPAIDSADPTSSNLATDQRNVPRPRDGDNDGLSFDDIGAVEINRPIGPPSLYNVDRVDDANVSDCTTAPNDCTLRGAITSANNLTGDDTINFDNVVFASAQTIILNGTELRIIDYGSLTINGTGVGLLTISGNNRSSVFSIGNGTNVKINNMTVGGGLVSIGGGGGINNGGILSLDKLSVSGNASIAAVGAGIFNVGILTMTNSTVANNYIAVRGPGVNFTRGGGISNTGTLSLFNSTVSGNTAQFGGGISNDGSMTLSSVTISANRMTENDSRFSGGLTTSTNVNIRNTIISGNLSAGDYQDVLGTFSSLGYNLIGNTIGSSGFSIANNDILNPSGGAMLGSLAFNGGSTQTHALLVGSPAIDNGKSFGSGTDQRGYFRPFDNSTLPNAPGGDGTDIGAFEKDAFARRTPFDFDGDNKTDISIYRPTVGEWWYLRSSDNANRAFQFGNSTDKIAPADFTGDGKTDIAFFRPSNGFWYILRSEDNLFTAFPFGTNGDIPAPADYDGDGKADAAVFRPSTATWYISKSSGGTIFQQFGATGDAPVVADYDGDGKADIAIYRVALGQWWILRSSDGTNRVYTFGVSTDKPVQGDYTGDGKADVAFYRPSTGFWYILRSEDTLFFAFPFGAVGDIPTPGDYDGDGKSDAAIFRPSAATWYLSRSTAGLAVYGFGVNGDLPVASAFVP